jgi:hypothetical protein
MGPCGSWHRRAVVHRLGTRPCSICRRASGQRSASCWPPLGEQENRRGGSQIIGIARATHVTMGRFALAPKKKARFSSGLVGLWTQRALRQAPLELRTFGTIQVFWPSPELSVASSCRRPRRRAFNGRGRAGHGGHHIERAAHGYAPRRGLRWPRSPRAGE